MSNVRDELDFWGRQVHRQAQSNPFREKMQEFVSDSGSDRDIKEVRDQISGGTPIGEIVDKDRNERL